jgi:hypothetical protein
MWRYNSDFNDNESLYRQILVKHELEARKPKTKGKKKFPQDEKKIMSCNFYDSFFSFSVSVFHFSMWQWVKFEFYVDGIPFLQHVML